MVLGGGRDVRQELGRLQLPPGRGAPPPGSQGHHHGVLDGRPLRRRHPHHGRLPVAGEPELVVHHARAQRASARPAPGRRGLARHLDAAARERLALDPRVAPAPAARRVLEARIGVRGLRRHRVSGLRGGRLGGPVHEPGVPVDGAPRRAAQGARRALGPPVSAPGVPGAGRRVPRGEPAVVGPVAHRKGRGERLRGRTDDPGLDARQRPTGGRPGAGRRPVGGRGGMAERPDPGTDLASRPERAPGRAGSGAPARGRVAGHGREGQSDLVEKRGRGPGMPPRPTRRRRGLASASTPRRSPSRSRSSAPRS